MALAKLLSWVKEGLDSFPNIAGVGGSTSGAGASPHSGANNLYGHYN